MSSEWNERAGGFNVLYGAVVVAYGPESSPSGGFGARSRSAADATNYLPPPQWHPALASSVGEEISRTAAEARANRLAPAAHQLSGRQFDVLRLIVQGRSNKEIARTLKLAEGTVKIHVAGLFSKLGVHRRAAVAVAGARLLAETSRSKTSM